MSESHAAFWENDEYGRVQSTGPASRLGSQVRTSPEAQRCWDGTWDDARLRRVRFAEAVWSEATKPAVLPAYVSCHPRVASGRVRFNSRDVTLTGLVELVVPWPQHLARTRAWQRGGQWMDWPADVLAGVTCYREPDENETTRYRYLLSLGRLIFPLSIAWLPAAPDGPDRDLGYAAREAVKAVISAMNMMVTPVIRTLEENPELGREG
jgi:hypothetical protein